MCALVVALSADKLGLSNRPNISVIFYFILMPSSKQIIVTPSTVSHLGSELMYYKYDKVLNLGNKRTEEIHLIDLLK